MTRQHQHIIVRTHRGSCAGTDLIPLGLLGGIRDVGLRGGPLRLLQRSVGKARLLLMLLIVVVVPIRLVLPRIAHPHRTAVDV